MALGRTTLEPDFTVWGCLQEGATVYSEYTRYRCRVTRRRNARHSWHIVGPPIRTMSITIRAFNRLGLGLRSAVLTFSQRALKWNRGNSFSTNSRTVNELFGGEFVSEDHR